MKKLARTVAVSIAGLAFAAACSSSSSPASGECVPGVELACACPSGGSGVQLCLSNGSGYLQCICASSGPDGGTTTSSGRDGGKSGSSSSHGDGGPPSDGRVGPSEAGQVDGGGHHDALGPGTDGGGHTPCSYLETDTVDHDGDGWAPADGDCNDCNKFINPGAYDVPGDGVDEDCDGTADDEPTGCDAALDNVATSAGSDGAKAIDLCRTTTATAPLPMKTWGVLSADYVLPDGTATPTMTDAGTGDGCTYTAENFELGFGILGPTFGTSNMAQQGEHMLGLSSGTARQPTDPGYSDPATTLGFDKCYTSGTPAGFPGQTPACPGITFGPAHDGAALRVVLRVPTNALTMSFEQNFFSHEFPAYVCSAYDDTYVVIMTPSPPDEPSTAHDNVVFDSSGNVLSVNSALLTVCDPGAVANYPCTEGVSKLAGTGFAAADAPDMMDHASTDWVTTTVDVASLAGDEITLLFAVWDSSDGLYDSTVLIDDVHWTFATSADQAPPTPTAPTTVPK